MGQKVAPEIVARATKCWAEFSCLNGGAAPLCKVKEPIADSYVALHSLHNPGCPYRLSCGANVTACACPVRNALYRQHGV